jgi:hypothetical protein
LESLEALLELLTPLARLGRPALAAIDGRKSSSSPISISNSCNWRMSTLTRIPASGTSSVAKVSHSKGKGTVRSRYSLVS